MDIAATVAVDCLDLVTAGTRPLVVDESSGMLAAALAARGSLPLQWCRCAGGPITAQPWPDAENCTSAFVRMPKSKDALDLALHAAASRLAPAAAVVVFGGNDEGIRSASARLAAVADDIATLSVKRHCRVMGGRRRPDIAGLRSRPADWRRVGQIRLGGGTERPWISYPGCFAKGALDPGTALLLDHLPDLPKGARVLDFAAGTGIVAAAVASRQASAALDLIEIDSLALEAARENVPDARAIAGTSLAAVAGARYDLIVSNPPIHAGVAEDHGVLADLIGDAPQHLNPGGRLLLVVQRRVRADAMIAAAFGAVERVAATGAFQVLAGIKRRH